MLLKLIEEIPSPSPQTRAHTKRDILRSQKEGMAHKRSSNRVDSGKGAGVGEKRKGITHRYRTHASVLGVFIAVAVGAWLGPVFRPHSHAFSKRAERALQNRRSFEGRRGPWGQFQYSRIAISMPEEYALDEPGKPIRWWFQGFSRERVESLFKGADLTSGQLASLGQSKWEPSSEGVFVEPPRQLVADLSPVSRGRIYEVLAG